MGEKRWHNLVTAQMGFTRVDSNRSSIIDHVLVNKGAAVDLASTTITRVVPRDSSDAGFSAWRQSFSDHFPLLFELKVLSRDNDVD